MASVLPRRVAWLIVLPALLIAGAVYVTARVERDASIRAGNRQAASQRMLTAMLDQETGARGYFQTHELVFLEPWSKGSLSFPVALSESRTLSGGDRSLERSLDEQARISASWHAATERAIDAFTATGTPLSLADALRRKASLDSFRAANASYASQLDQRRNQALALATVLAVAVAAGLAIIFAGGGFLILRRVTRIESERQLHQSELRELLQASESEAESRNLLIGHIEKIVPGAGAASLNRNNSDDRLEVLVSAGAAKMPLHEMNTERLRPRSCLAVRLSHAHERRADEQSLAKCDVCGRIKANVACEPLLVGGEVIGSVLVARAKAIRPGERARLRDAVTQSAPILANQRNLVLAETRAASDALTGLPNRRSADQTVKRMVAHASRTVSPLAAVLLDLDHFKQINDLHGHEHGDEVLAVVGQVLTVTLRTSDFAARYGGEEFLMLLPDTPREGAVLIAERLRVAIERADVSKVGSISASLGVAVLPDDAVDAEQLIRKADRALYLAKDRGRNRVEVAVPSGVETSPHPDQLVPAVGGGMGDS